MKINTKAIVTFVLKCMILFVALMVVTIKTNVFVGVRVTVRNIPLVDVPLKSLVPDVLVF